MASAPLTSAADSIAGIFRYDSLLGGGPMQIDWAAKRTCSELLSAVECTATVSIPSSRAARMTRRAISPRLAIRMRWNMGVGELKSWRVEEAAAETLHILNPSTLHPPSMLVRIGTT